jgi:hypothetical protein
VVLVVEVVVNQLVVVQETLHQSVLVKVIMVALLEAVVVVLVQLEEMVAQVEAVLVRNLVLQAHQPTMLAEAEVAEVLHLL